MQINWQQYLTDIYSLAGITVPADETVIVIETDYLKKMVDLLDKTPTRTLGMWPTLVLIVVSFTVTRYSSSKIILFYILANYIHWRFVKDLGGYTNTQMRDLAFAYSSAVYGTTQPEARFVARSLTVFKKHDIRRKCFECLTTLGQRLVPTWPTTCWVMLQVPSTWRELSMRSPKLRYFTRTI